MGLAAEYDQNGTLQKEYGYLPGQPYMTNPVFQRTSTSFAYYQNDHLGTPQRLIDKQGITVWQASYDAFGKATVNINTVENNLRFAGQYFDSESSLHQNWFRDYDPETGRYLERDPVGLRGGINTYAYVMGNPVMGMDPWGLITFCEALTKIRDNPNKFTDGSDLYTGEIGEEQDVLQDLGLPFTTSDGFDLQYFLVQFKFSNSVDPLTAYFGMSAVEWYIVFGSARSAYTRSSGFYGFLNDVAADSRGNKDGHDAARSGLDQYISDHCGDCK